MCRHTRLPYCGVGKRLKLNFKTWNLMEISNFRKDIFMVHSYFSKDDTQLDFNRFSTITQSSPREDVSNKYSFISTSRVLETLEKEGWKPSNIQEASTIHEDNKG